MTLSLVLIAAGLALSAFFSGTETGLYRAARVRLVLDGRSGDVVSRGLLWLTNNPALFVATTLIGNNLANYVVSLGTVLLAHHLVAPGSESHVAEFALPLLSTPIVFVYGELLPKSLFYHAPNRLLRLAGPPLLFFTVIFAPLSTVLWACGRVLQRIAGSTPLRVKLTLARKELQQVLVEGKEAGLLYNVQQRLVENLFETATDALGPFIVPLDKLPRVPIGATRNSALAVAAEHKLDALPIYDVHLKRLVGYVRVADLYLTPTTLVIDSPLPLTRIPSDEHSVSALIQLEHAHADMGEVVDSQGRTVGVVLTRRLAGPLFDNL